VDEFDGVQLGGETEVSDAESLQRGAAALHYQSNGPSADDLDIDFLGDVADELDDSKDGDLNADNIDAALSVF
ncbi:MAG: hypothetical protein AAFP69_05885, partial [Planctomycetota bacterium]